MITADELVAWRTRIGFSQGHVARYLDWGLGTYIAYENGRALPAAHEAKLAQMMGITVAADEPSRPGLARQFTTPGRAGLSEVELMETYRQIATNPVYDSLTRERCDTRYRMLEALFRRQPKGF